MAKKFPPCARAVVVNGQGEVLLLLRPKDADLAPNAWCLPGGDLEDGEEPVAGARRELQEETGLVAGPLTAETTFEFPGGSGTAALFTDGVKDVDGDEDFGVRINAESAGYGWFPPGSLPKPLLGRTTEVIAALLGTQRADAEETGPARPGNHAPMNTTKANDPGGEQDPGQAALDTKPGGDFPMTAGGDDVDNSDEALTAEERRKVRSWAFPRLKKVPLENASHVRNALARWQQVEGATAEEKKEARRLILAAAKKFGVEAASLERTDASATRVNRIDRGTFRTPTKTPEGFLKLDAYATRVGVFNYVDPSGAIRRELRLPEEVFDEASLVTLAEKPVTDEHPHVGLLDATTASRFARGWTGETIHRDGDFVRAGVTITDAKLVQDVVQSIKREVSCGYSCDLVPEPGVWRGQAYDAVQRNIRYNHLAVVPKGRAGSEVRLRMDAAEQVSAEEGEAMAKIRIDGAEFEVSEAVAAAYTAKERMDAKSRKEMEDEAAALKKKIDDSEEELDALKKQHGEMKSNLDKVQAKADHLEEQAKTRTDAGQLQALVKARVALEKTAGAILPADTKLDAMDDQAIRVAVVKHVSPSVNLDGKSETYIEARYDAALEVAAKRTDSSGTLREHVETARQNGSGDAAKEAREKLRQDSVTAYQKPASEQ